MHIRLSLAAVAASLASAAIAQPASASIWTEIPSGTTQNITAIEYQSASRFWFTTVAGAIFKRQPNGTFAQVARPAGGVPLNDIEFQAGGQIGLAVGNGGLVLRSTNGGDTWTPITACRCSSTTSNCQRDRPRARRPQRGALRRQRPRVDLCGGPADRAFAAGEPRERRRRTGRTPIATPGTGRHDDTCKVSSSNIYSEGYADAFFAAPGRRLHRRRVLLARCSSRPTTSPPRRSSSPRSAGNAGTASRRVIAGDPENPNRMWSVNAEPYGRSTTAYTRDGWADRRLVPDRQRHGARLPEHRPGRRRLRGRHRPRRR